MSRLIDADALMEILEVSNWVHITDYNIAIYAVKDAPTVDAVPVVHGEWIPKFNGKFKGGAYWYECSGCSRTVPGGLQSGYYYCPHCGARMDGKGNGNG